MSYREHLAFAARRVGALARGLPQEHTAHVVRRWAELNAELADLPDHEAAAIVSDWLAQMEVELGAKP